MLSCQVFMSYTEHVKSVHILSYLDFSNTKTTDFATTLTITSYFLSLIVRLNRDETAKPTRDMTLDIVILLSFKRGYSIMHILCIMRIYLCPTNRMTYKKV